MRDATNQAQPGDLIKVAPGSYSMDPQWWIEAKGTATHPIYIVADGARGSVKVTVPNDEGINVGGNASYLVFENLEVSRTGNNVFHVQDGAHHITLRNLNLHDAGPDGDILKINQAHHITVEGCDLARPGQRPDGNDAVWQEVLDLVDADDSVLRYNFLHDFGNMAGYVKGGSERVVVEYNVIDGQRAGAGDPSYGIGGWTDADLFRGAQYEAIGTIFRHNAILHGVNGALGLYDAGNTTIENNLFLNNDVVLIQPRAGNAPLAKTDTVLVTGNRFVDTRGSMPNVCSVLNHDLSGMTFRTNTYWNAGHAIPSSDTSCSVTPGSESGAVTQNLNVNDSRPSTYSQAMGLLNW